MNLGIKLQILREPLLEMTGGGWVNEDNDFEFRQNIHVAQFNGIMMDDEEVADYGQQFDTIFKDLISSER